MGRLRAWFGSDEARDAALPAVVFQVVVHLYAALLPALSSRGDLAGRDALSAWLRWDAAQYLGIAADGYSATASPERIVFFPLFPLLVRIGSAVAHPIVVASLVSAVATVVAAVGLYRLARLDAPREVARWSVLFLLAFPTSYSLAAPYSEALFLAAATWALVLARTQVGVGAGVAGLLAGLARLQGVFLVPALLLEAMRDRRRRAVAIAWALVPALAIAVYLGINAAVFGDPLAFLPMQRQYWFHENAPPWKVIGPLVGAVLAGPKDDRWLTVSVAPLLSFGLLAVASAWAVASRRSRPSYAAYTVLTTLSLATLTWPISVPRYVMGVVPVFLMLGGLARWPRLATVVVVGSAACMVSLTTVFLTGGWAP